MRILFIGDIVSKVGRDAVRKLLPTIVEEHKIELVIANGENATHGRGLAKKHYQQLLSMGIEVITLGNHFDDRQEIRDYIGRTNTLVRPLNLIEEYPGEGSIVITKNGIKIRVTNLLLESFMKRPVQSPYARLAMLLNEVEPSIHIVDVHGEATAEKLALAYAFDGRFSAMLGTHTHVQTRDYQILPNGTAYISDVGMTGPKNGIIGVEKNSVIQKMWFDRDTHYVYDEKDEGLLSAVVFDVDEATYKATGIYPLYLTVR
jgi:metallophosphoesterase (TIGR00282 family)